MRRVATAVLGAALAVGLLGAVTPARADSGHGSAGGTKPCKVLTRAEITAAFGQPAGKGSDALGSTFCQWDLATTADRERGQVNVFVEHGKAAKRDYKLAGGSPDAEPVAGLGRVAVYLPSTGTLWVLAPGPTLYYVQANLYADAQTRITDGVRDGLVELAQQAEARL